MFNSLYKHIWPIMLKYKKSMILTFVFFGATVVVDNVVKNFYLKKIIDIAVSTETVNRIDLFKPLLFYVYLSAGALILGYIFSRLGSWANNYFQNNLIRELNNYTFNKITNHSYSFFANNFSGSLVSKIKRFTNGFKFVFHNIVLSFWPLSMLFLFSFFVIYSLIPIFAYILALWFVLYIIVILFFIKRKFPYDIKKSEMDSKVGGRFADVFSNIINLKIFSANNFEKVNFEKLTAEEAKHRGYAWFLGNQQRAIKAFFMVFIQILLLYLEVKFWSINKISTGTIVLLQTYLISIFGRLWDLDETLAYCMEYVADMKETIKIFETKPEIEDIENPEKCNIKNGEIIFKNVNFEYVEEQEVFKDFNLKINKGEKVGLVGHSGSGKTTITKMLLRFIDIKKGEITIDGQNIRNITQDDLRSTISYVPQDTILFHRSIIENIGYSKINATEAEIIESAKKAYADEFISKLQNGYDTLVGERGIKLSGGERQRVAIARAMLKNAPILVLDEATSSLDSISESYIKEALNELMKDKTAIVIAHRLSTIQKMDRIVVLDNGKIIEEGTHKGLIEKNGAYAKLWNYQTGFLNEE